MLHYINHKNVLFITTKNVDYIRNSQEISMLFQYALSYTIIGSNHKRYLRRLVSVYFSLLKTRVSQYDTVFVGFAPQLILPFFSFKFHDVDIIEDFFISFYDTLCCDRKKIAPNSLPGRLLHSLDEYTLQKAAVIYCDTNAHGAYFIQEFHADPAKLVTLYLQADTSIYHPMTVTRPPQLQDKFIVLYFGSVLPLQGVEIVLEAFDLLKNCKSMHFICIGPVSAKGLSAHKPVAPNIQYIDWLSQTQLASYIAMSNLCLAGHFNASIDKAKRTIPGKAYIYQAMNKPMILGDNPANHELFSNCEHAIFVEMGNARALANAILQFTGSLSPAQ